MSNSEDQPVSSIDLVLDFESESMRQADAAADTLRAPELAEEIARWAEEVEEQGGFDDDRQEETRTTRPALLAARAAAADGV